MQHTLLDDVKSHFDHWRATRNKRCRIPESLWDKVKSLVEHYPLSAITNALSLNTNQIRENIKIDTAINFVEARQEVAPLTIRQPIISASADTQTCAIELHRTTGAVLKISACPISSLPIIISQFIG
jgi:hypothetical protein